MVLSPAEKPPPEKGGDGNAAKKPFPPSASTQERMLKTKLKISRWTRTASKGGLEMLHGLPQRIRVCARRWREFAAQPCAQRVQPALELAPQAIPCFQGERPRELFHRSLERKSDQQFHQPSPQPRSRDGVTRQNVGEEKGKSASATAPLPPVGTKRPLAPERLGVRGVGIIAEGSAVPVQCSHAAAMRTRRLLEGKSWSFNSGASRTK